jgi:hypothetical protein
MSADPCCSQLRILGEHATAAEREVLGAIPYGENDVYLHTGGPQADGFNRSKRFQMQFKNRTAWWSRLSLGRSCSGF